MRRIWKMEQLSLFTTTSLPQCSYLLVLRSRLNSKYLLQLIAASSQKVYPCRQLLRVDHKNLNTSSTPLQLAKMQERMNALRRKINAWIVIQHLYMPEVAVLRSRDDKDASDDGPESPIYEAPLYLPSSLSRSMPCNDKLLGYEFKLREAQAYEALDELRQHLRLQTHMWKYKDRHVVGQRANTRQFNLIQRVDKKVAASAAKYRRARAALSKLADRVGEFIWRSQLLRLQDEDVRRMSEGEPDDSQGKKRMSWIWRVQGVSENSEDEGLQEGMLFVRSSIRILGAEVFFSASYRVVLGAC